MRPGSNVRIIDHQHPRFMCVGTVDRLESFPDARIIATINGFTETFYRFELQAVVWNGLEWVKAVEP